jgi:hypothetical protein
MASRSRGKSAPGGIPWAVVLPVAHAIFDVATSASCPNCDSLPGRALQLHQLQEAGVAEPRRHSLGPSSRATGGEYKMATSKSDASKAAKLLANPKTSKVVKSVAGSDLSQAKGSGKGKGKK